MSQDPQISSAQTLLIDRELMRLNADLLREGADARTVAIALEANQRALDYMDELAEREEPARPVVVKVDGTKVRFADSDGLANWIAGVWHGK